MKYLEVIAQVIIGIGLLTLVVLYVSLIITWSDADYCKQGIDTQVTCRDYTLFNWVTSRLSQEENIKDTAQ